MDDELEALKAETSHGDRLDEVEEAGDGDRAVFVEAVLAELEAIEAGEQQKTVSVWDGHSAAFVRALEADDEHRQAVGEALREAVGVEADGEVERSEIVRLALRLGFATAAPEEFEAVREAARTQATKGL